MADWRSAAAVGLGGAAGTCLRAAIAGSPTTTLAVNMVGALCLGVLLGALGDRHRLARLALGTGLLGGLTTHSAFILHSHDLMTTGHGGLGVVHLLGSFMAGVVAAAAGLRLGSALRRPRRTP